MFKFFMLVFALFTADHFGYFGEIIAVMFFTFVIFILIIASASDNKKPS